MSEWLDVMLEEIRRKNREAEEAREELDRRRSEESAVAQEEGGRSVEVTEEFGRQAAKVRGGQVDRRQRP